MSVWFITGCSRGFGRELVREALSRGHEIVATARRADVVRDAFPDAGDALMPLTLDVTDPDGSLVAVAAAQERFGRIDVLVNNAGYGLFGAVEEVADAEARAVFETNVFGLLNVTRAVLPVMRGQGTGHVLNMSSSAGFVSSAGRGLYSASKFAVEGISEALHAEVAPLGVHVTVVEPGSFRTEFLTADSRRRPMHTIPDYNATVGPLQRAIDEGSGRQPGDPAQAAAVMCDLVEQADPPLRVQLGSDCVDLVERKLRFVGDELARHIGVAQSTDIGS